jgi:hypothetical protein
MAIKERQDSGAISGTVKSDRGCTAAKIVLNYYSREDGRVAQLGERVLCKHEQPFQRFLPLFFLSNVFNNFGESASRSK